jgi:hypothetical protein
MTNGSCLVSPGTGTPFGDGGDHVTGAFHLDGVTHADVFSRDLIRIVEGGPADRDTSDLHRLQQGQRRQGAGATDRDGDVLNDRDFFSGCKLVSDGPTGAAGFATELVLPRPAVEFDDDAVDFKR